MILRALLMAAALWQQQPGRATVRLPGSQSTAFDSTKDIVAAIGQRVAGVRSSLELFRRAVFNSPDAEVLSTAAGFRLSCHSLDSAATAGARKMCRSCAERSIRSALNGYRAVLPSVSRVGAQCAARLARLSRGEQAAEQLRRDVRVVGNAIVKGLVPYERRLQTLRVAAGWAQRPPRAGPRP
jgi:hypothetical protein